MIDTKSTYLIFLLLTVFAIKSSAFVQCDNDRGCPDSYECDESTNGTFCCQNSTCDVRSSWSLLSSECKHRPPYFCYPVNFCDRPGESCFSKKVQTCDFYLKFEKILTCGDNGYFIHDGFPMCNKIYRTHSYHLNRRAILQCSESCIQEKISNAASNDEKNCTKMKEYVIGNYSGCYSECNACYVPDSWPIISNLIYEHHKESLQNVIKDFAAKCSKRFEMSVDQECPCSLKKKSLYFIGQMRELANIDLSEYFLDLIIETTTTPLIETTTTPLIEITTPLIETTTISESTTTTPLIESTTIAETTTTPLIETTTSTSLIETTTITENTTPIESTSLIDSTTTDQSSDSVASSFENCPINQQNLPFLDQQSSLTHKNLMIIGFLVLCLYAISSILMYKFLTRPYSYNVSDKNGIEMSYIRSEHF